MKNYKFIPNRLTNLAGTMPLLKVDYSIDNRMNLPLLIVMLPINVKKNNFDILVLVYKVDNENVTIFPLGILGNSEHLSFPTGGYASSANRLKAWVGKARFLDYSLSILYLEVARYQSFSSKDLRNLNNVAEKIYNTYQWKEHFSDREYAGHKFLIWY